MSLLLFSWLYNHLNANIGDLYYWSRYSELVEGGLIIATNAEPDFTVLET